ncbi:S41 family peptidase [Pseudoalteromonas xiamenensis]
MKFLNSALMLYAMSPLSAFAQSAWSVLVETDIKHIYSTTRDNHPGFIDDENSYFKQWLEIGYVQALEAAKSAESLDDALTITQRYIAGFADGHFGFGSQYQPRYLTWTGLNIELFGDDYRVSFVDEKHSEHMPSALAKLMSCDGVPVQTIMDNDLLPYRFNAPNLRFPKVRFASKLLLNDGIGKQTQFRTCQFEHQGKVETIPLSWQPISQNRYNQKTQNQTPPKKFAFETVAPKQYWASFPSFSPNDKQLSTLRTTIHELAEVSSAAERIIIDVRGNGGGNSEWGVEIAKALYGESFIESHLQQNPDNSYALWRVSSDNTEYLKQILPQLEIEFGKDSAMYADFSTLAQDMSDALQKNQQFVKQGSSTPQNQTISPSLVNTKTQAHIIFLTDSRCSSACLDFADLLLKLPNVNHVGQETGADTVYMEVRVVALPSRLGMFSLAQKVYRGRQRLHNESYVPTYNFSGDIEDTKQLKTWINSLVF